MCGGGVRSILLLPLVARCLETIDVCIWRMFVSMSVVLLFIHLIIIVCPVTGMNNYKYGTKGHLTMSLEP